MAQTKKVSSTPTKTNSSSTATKKQPTASEMREFQKEALKKELCCLIKSEDTKHPYSDAQLTNILSTQFGRSFSRRLIQKYRIQLHIPNSYERYG